MCTSFDNYGLVGSCACRFIVIKLPAKTMGANHFYYMDDSNPSWTLADSTLDQPSNAVYYTLQQVYNKGRQEPVRFHAVCCVEITISDIITINP